MIWFGCRGYEPVVPVEGRGPNGCPGFAVQEGIKPPDGVRFLPPPPPYGTSKEVIQFWFGRARLQTRRFFDDWPADANLDAAHEGGLRVMNGLEWFEGYGGHEVVHHQQIDRLIAQLPQSA